MNRTIINIFSESIYSAASACDKAQQLELVVSRREEDVQKRRKRSSFTSSNRYILFNSETFEGFRQLLAVTRSVNIVLWEKIFNTREIHLVEEVKNYFGDFLVIDRQ